MQEVLSFIGCNLAAVEKTANEKTNSKVFVLEKRNSEEQSGEYDMTVTVLMELVLWYCTCIY